MQNENPATENSPRLIGRKKFALSALAVGAGAFFGIPSRAWASGGTSLAYLDVAQTFTADQTFNGNAKFAGGDPWFDVKAFGAVGSGSGSDDDTDAINAAISHLPATGGTVFLPAGRYMVGKSLSGGPNTITLPANARLAGTGLGLTEIRSQSVTPIDVITSSGTHGVEIRDLTICSATPCGTVPADRSGISFTNVSDFQIENVCCFDTCSLGMFVNCSRGVIKHLRVKHGGGTFLRGFYFQGCREIQLRHIFISGANLQLPSTNAFFQIDSGCDTFELDDISAAGFSSGGYGRGLWLSDSAAPGAPNAPKWIRVSNFYFEASDGTTALTDDIVIDSCVSAYFSHGYCSTANNGICVNGGTEIRFSNVLMMRCKISGAVVASGVTDITFDGCTISDVSQTATGTSPGIRTGASRGVIKNCYFGTEVLNTGKIMSYGVVSTSASTLVINCKFANLTTGVSGPTSNGFYGSTAIVPPLVTGSAGSNIALDNLVSVLVQLGFVTTGASYSP